MNKNFNSFIQRLNKLKNTVDQCVSWFLISIVGSMTILVTYQVIIRYIFNSPSAFSEVLSRYLFIWLILFGAAYVFGLREHMAITFIKEKFNKKTRIIIEMVIELVTVIFAYTVMISGGYSSAARQMWQIDSALQIPMGTIYAAIPISGGLIFFYFVFNEMKLLNALVNDKEVV
ncbi:TRAP transporter small permease [Vibrio sp. CK2-1]|uniref:TRAP transporter small permease n=1 Tax=Vibrio sp. CK2-1 TaxID=2912249 RepID=UPI001F20FBA7|nr:TRAP transporter small permease [Vibrio sp. CK2-1]MCF7352975.1 TRAP transporter small permease [Vibrio sp. CK2-1]